MNLRETDSPPGRRDVARSVPMWVIACLLYPAWMGMMAVHESGHVLHALVSGGKVARVTLPPLDFSRTDLSHNPHPQFVAWGGPIWGCAIPLAMWVVSRRFPWHVVREILQLFAGFCLVANGAYLGVGWMIGVGDAGDLLRHGAQVRELIAFGVVTVATGLYLWHRVGSR